MRQTNFTTLMSLKRSCPQCGGSLPDNGWAGLCPRCLVRVSLEEAGTRSTTSHTGSEQAADVGERVPTPIAPPDLPSERVGTTIGRYKLLQQIGEGGFGIVFMAEQSEPVQRKVALKVIKAGMDTQEIILRFEAERQALALMDHPNIAQVLDGGTTQTGRPYFVMELVRGVPLTAYCDQARLSTRERLSLFVQVCRAVQHAHQKGVIHRDIKPSNILVTPHDGEPVPKVIDFGVAKALGQKLTQKTLFTPSEQMIGTPAYMSPEQAALGGLDIDTRSDIYSLGVLLYELLTGVTPLDEKILHQGPLDEIRRSIRETDPPKPSTRLASLVAGDARPFSESKIQNPKSKIDELSSRQFLQQKKELIGAVRGDLDWITMKALEKDRQRRYETVNALVVDVERHLKNEPVVARPPSALYRLQKLSRRHRVAFVAGGVVALSLVVGLIATSWQAIRATRAEAQARREAAENQAIMEILEQTLSKSDPGGESIRQSLLDSATQWLNQQQHRDVHGAEDFVRTMQQNMLNFRRADSAESTGTGAGSPTVTAFRAEQQAAGYLAATNLDLIFQTASNNARLAFGQRNYAEAITEAQKALAIRPKDAGIQQLTVEVMAELDEARAVRDVAWAILLKQLGTAWGTGSNQFGARFGTNAASPPQLLKGLVFVPSIAEVAKKGAPGALGVVVAGPPFLRDKSFEVELGSLFGKPINEIELLRTQKKIVDWCRREGHPLVDVVIPEQDIVDGVLQVAVIDYQVMSDQVKSAHFSPDGHWLLTESDSAMRIWNVQSSLRMTNALNSTNSQTFNELRQKGGELVRTNAAGTKSP